MYWYWITYLRSYRFTLESSYSTPYLPKVEMDQEYLDNNYRIVVGNLLRFGYMFRLVWILNHLSRCLIL